MTVPGSVPAKVPTKNRRRPATRRAAAAPLSDWRSILLALSDAAFPAILQKRYFSRFGLAAPAPMVRAQLGAHSRGEAQRLALQLAATAIPSAASRPTLEGDSYGRMQSTINRMTWSGTRLMLPECHRWRRRESVAGDRAGARAGGGPDLASACSARGSEGGGRRRGGYRQCRRIDPAGADRCVEVLGPAEGGARRLGCG